jgi:hypothetical protein
MLKDYIKTALYCQTILGVIFKILKVFS